MSTTPTITLDELILTHKAGTVKEYIVSSHYNKHKQGATSNPQEELRPGPGKPDNTEVKFKIKDQEDSAPVKPVDANYDFTKLHSDSDLLDIVLYHETTAKRNYIANHVAINDTRYPPPYNVSHLSNAKGLPLFPTTPHDTFSAQFTVKDLKIERNSAPRVGFDVSITLENNDKTTFYKIGSHGISIQTDIFNQSNGISMQAIILNVEATTFQPHPNIISFKGVEMDLAKFYTVGIPIIVAELDPQTSLMDWPEITMKKGAISIQ